LGLWYTLNILLRGGGVIDWPNSVESTEFSCDGLRSAEVATPSEDRGPKSTYNLSAVDSRIISLTGSFRAVEFSSVCPRHCFVTILTAAAAIS